MKERFSLDYYRTFGVVYESRSFSEAARRLYESFGFVQTGRDEDEIIMELTF